MKFHICIPMRAISKSYKLLTSKPTLVFAILILDQDIQFNPQPSPELDCHQNLLNSFHFMIEGLEQTWAIKNMRWCILG